MCGPNLRCTPWPRRGDPHPTAPATSPLSRHPPTPLLSGRIGHVVYINININIIDFHYISMWVSIYVSMYVCMHFCMYECNLCMYVRDLWSEDSTYVEDGHNSSFLETGGLDFPLKLFLTPRHPSIYTPTWPGDLTEWGLKKIPWEDKQKNSS